MEHIARLLPKKLRREDAARQVLATIVVRAAKEVVKDMFPDDESQIRVRSFRNGMLAFACDGAFRAMDIMRREKEVIRRVNARLAQPEVSRVRAVG